MKIYRWQTTRGLGEARPRRWFLADWEAVNDIIGLGVAKAMVSQFRTWYP